MDTGTRKTANAYERPTHPARPASHHGDNSTVPAISRCDAGHHPSDLYIELPVDDNLYLRPEQVLRPQLSPECAAGYLRTLLKTNASLLGACDRAAFFQTLLNDLLDITGSGRAVLAKLDGDSGKAVAVSAIARGNFLKTDEIGNESLIDRALCSGVSFAVNCAKQGNSRLTVPLAAFNRVIGAIQLEAPAPARYCEDTLRLIAAIGAIAASVLERTGGLEALTGQPGQFRPGFKREHGIVGRSSQIHEVRRFIDRVAPVETTVLIHGESGTGKELVVRALHENSIRSKGSFVALNCAALTETLLESELFGHEKGSFTGAAGQKKGLLEAANGGTFFLDELGELAPPLQAKLLRAIQERAVVRVGGVHPIPVDIRLVGATNRDLAQEVRKGTFRQDLYYRLNVVSVKLPPLRERGNDVLLLANHFLGKYARESGRSIRGISPEARSLLTQYDWPGNVRELQNAIERAVLFTDSDIIEPRDLPEAIYAHSFAASNCGSPGFRRGITELKKQMLQQAIEQSGGNLTEAARQLGVHRNYVYRLVRSMKLRDKQPKRA